MLARSRALSCIAVLATMGCNLENPGDAPPRALIYFPNAIALSPFDATSVAPADATASSPRDLSQGPSHLLVANSDFDLRYRDGNVQSYSIVEMFRAFEAMAQQPGCPGPSCSCPGPACIIEPTTPGVLVGEAMIGPFSTAVALSPDGTALFAATRTDDTLTVLTLDGNGQLGGCGDHACPAGLAKDADRRSKPLAWPGNPVAILSGPMSHWAKPGQSLSGDYVMVAHRAGAVSLFAYRAGSSGGRELTLVDVLEGLPALTELAYDPGSGLVHLSVASPGSVRILARVGVAIAPSADATSPELGARLYDAGSIGLDGVPSGNDSRDLSFAPAISAPDAASVVDRALVLSTDPSAVLVVDVRASDTPAGTARVERSVAVASGPQRIVSGVVAGRPIAVVACFDARQLFVIDLDTMLTRSVVPNLSGPFDLVLDAQRQVVYLTDFRSSVIRIVDLAPALEPGEGSGKPARVIATLGRPQILPELQ